MTGRYSGGGATSGGERSLKRVWRAFAALLSRLREVARGDAPRVRDSSREDAAPVGLVDEAATASEHRACGGDGLDMLVFGIGDLYQLGGVQLSYKRLFEYLCGKGHRIKFYSHRAEDAERRLYYPFPAQVTVSYYRLLDTAKSWEQVREIARREAPDCILVVNSGQTALVLVAALYDLPFPIVFSERGAPDFTLEHSWCSRTQRELAHLAADWSHVLMPSYAQAAPQFLRDWVRVIPSLTEAGIGLADVCRPRDGRFTILYTGRFSFGKDLDLLVRAFVTLADRHPEWDLVLLGDGPEADALQELVDKLGVRNRVFIPGAAESLDAVFRSYLSAHLFVTPSRAEGCPLSLREAMAHGLPVIGFATTSGVNEIIEHGRNGLLAAGEDRIAALGAALDTLMGNAAERERMGREGVTICERFAPDVVHAAWESLLVDAAAWRGRRPELRALKRGRGGAEYEQLHDTLDSVCRQQHARNIVAYAGSVREGRASAELLSQYLLVYGTCLFDNASYCKRHPEVKRSGVDPLEHYLTEGWRLGHVPSVDFDLSAFQQAWPGQHETSPLVDLYRRRDLARLRAARVLPTDKLAALMLEWEGSGICAADDMDVDVAAAAQLLRRIIDWRPVSADEWATLRRVPPEPLRAI